MEQVSSRIDQVTVYHHGARVRRRVELTWNESPPYSIEVVDLPLSLEDSSVRVRIERVDGDAIIDATNLRVGLYVPPAPDVGEVPDAEILRKALQAIEHNEEAQDQLRTELAMLQGIAVPERPDGEEGKPAPASPMSSRLALEQILDGASVARSRELRELQQRRRDLERDAAELQRKLLLASSVREFKPHELRKSVMLSLIARNGVSKGATLVVEYLSAGARWAPAYQCRMDRDGRRADIVMRAHVCQRTGEDWSGVSLTLSTASPIAWTELPEPTSIRIGKAQRSPARARFRPPPRGAASLFLDFDRDLAQVNALVPTFESYEAPAIEIPSRPSLERDSSGSSRSVSAEKKRSMKRAAPPAPAAEASAPFYQITDSDIDNLFDDGEDDEPASNDDAPMACDEAELLAEPAPALAPAPAAGPSRDLAKGGRTRGEGVGEATSARAILRYGDLRLSSAFDAALRTQLTSVDELTTYSESLGRRGRVVRFNEAIQEVSRVRGAATSISSISLPQGGCDVRECAGNFDYAYATDAVVDVPSDGMFHSIPVGTRSAEADVRYVVVPREDTSVFRLASITNPLRAPLLPGPVEIYVGGDYVLTTQLPNVPAGGDFKLGLGVEQSIKCARNTTFHEVRSGNKVVATNELWHRVSIELVNNLQRQISIEVRERIPVPAKDAEVVVEEGAIAPAWEVWDQAALSRKIEGGRRWDLSVAANTTVRLEAEYVVKIYANNELSGGNRREV